MADTSGSSTPIIIPANVREKFGELVDLILSSESMNDDERRYWIDILPAMSPEQISKLREILAKEHDQLAAIDAKYAKNMGALANEKAAQATGEQRRARSEERSSSEAAARADEALEAEQLLDQMKDL